MVQGANFYFLQFQKVSISIYYNGHRLSTMAARAEIGVG